MFSYGSEEIEMHNYLMAGKELAYKLNNRGPIKFNDDGSLDNLGQALFLLILTHLHIDHILFQDLGP